MNSRCAVRRINGDFLTALFTVAVAAIAGGACGESVPRPPVKAVSFGTPAAKSYGDGRPLQSFDVGDIDGDGHLDVVANDQEHLVIFRGDGTGNLARPLDGAATLSLNMTMADVTGDGRADVVAAGAQSGNVRVFPARADGTFGPSIAYGVPAQFITRLLVVDMTGDGALDLLIHATNFDLTAGTSSFLAILPNRGNGVFDEPLISPLNVDPVGLTTADLDGDGTRDVALVDANVITGPMLLFNDGSGHLSAPQISLDALLRTPGPLVAGDFDGDGRPDLLTFANNGEQLTVLRNLGAATFQPLLPIDLHAFAGDLLAADLNKDGRTDVAVMLASGAMEILHADGVTLIPVAAYATGGLGGLVRSGDFDRDGAIDLVVANRTPNGDHLEMLMNDGRGFFDAMPLYPVPGNALTMALGDLTNDGLTDIVVATFDDESIPSLNILESSARGTLEARVAPTPLPAGSAGLLLGDLNADRIADVVVTSPDARALVLLGSGGGRLATPTSVDIGFGEKVAIGDLDGDAFLDLAVGSTEKFGDIRLFTGQGNGSFAPLQTYHAADGSTSALRITDMNGDGRADVVAALSGADTGIISILASSGLRGFAAPIATPVVPTVDTFAVTDLDRDGRADLVGNSTYSTEVPLLFGTARGRPFLRRSFDIGTIGAAMVSADFNNDGWTDLAFGDQISGGILVVLNDHSGAFPERQTLPLHVEMRGLGAADLNADGKVDLAVLTPAGVVVLWNTSE